MTQFAMTAYAAAYDLDEDLGYLLGRAYTESARSLLGALKPFDMTPRQFIVLTRLKKDGETSQNELGRRCGMKPATIFTIIDKLAERELISRRAHDSDSRQVLVSLTASAEAILPELEAVALEVGREALRPLDLAAQERLRLMLKAVLSEGRSAPAFGVEEE